MAARKKRSKATKPPKPNLTKLQQNQLEALAMSRKGHSFRAIGDHFGTSSQTAGRWVREAKKIEGAPPEEPAPTRQVKAPPAPDDAPDLASEDLESLDSLAMAKGLLRQAVRNSIEARNDGNHTAAQRYLRDAVAAQNQVLRAEKQQGDAQDGFVITAQEIAETRQRVRDRIAALEARPLLCTECSRRLSISFGGEKAEEHERRNDGA